MAENSLYFTAVADNRALLLSEEEALEGSTTISLETQADLIKEDVLSFITNHFEIFLKNLKFLKKEDQDLLLSYYILGRTQTSLATIHKSTQTVCSFRIRMAVKTLGTFMLMGGEPNLETLEKVLTKSGWENILKAPLSRVIVKYVETRNFLAVANYFNLHRPDIRRAMSRVSKMLMESKDGEEVAIAAWIHSLIDKVSPIGKGNSKRKKAKEGHLFLTLPEITGKFRISLDDPNSTQVFSSRANRH